MGEKVVEFVQSRHYYPPELWFSPGGEMIKVQWVDTSVYAKQISEGLELLLSVDNDQVVGVTIAGDMLFELLTLRWSTHDGTYEVDEKGRPTIKIPAYFLPYLQQKGKVLQMIYRVTDGSS